MLHFLIGKFIPNHEAVEDPHVRTAYGILAGALGIVLNLLLFALKLPIGLAMGSVAITSDAFNNISDMGSSLIGLIGAAMAGKRPDRDHPFGHGRIEYVSALAVSFIILLVGFELLKQSIGKLAQPAPVAFNATLLILLALSMGIKFWMYRYNKRLGALLDSQVMKATARDSLNDVFTTGAVVIATLLSRMVTWPIDAVAGLIVSLLIIYTGYSTAKDTIDLLLGGKGDPELSRKIAEMVCETESVVGIHDLILHDYGPGRVMASVHAEVPADNDIMRIHELIDEAEQRVARELGVPIVIHMDPVVTNNERLDALRAQVKQTIQTCAPHCSFHDFRMTDGENRINLIFDLVVPIEMATAERTELTERIQQALQVLDPRYCAVMIIDEA